MTVDARVSRRRRIRLRRSLELAAMIASLAGLVLAGLGRI
jgi:hypothetical protein